MVTCHHKKITFLKKEKTFFGNMSAPVEIHESKNFNELTKSKADMKF